jgi:leucine dehydrogenase
VAGSANNQLAQTEDAHKLQRRNILYSPDYVINAGGMLNASGDILGLRDPDEVRRRVIAIGILCEEIFTRAEREARSPAEVADDLARTTIARRAIQSPP